MFLIPSSDSINKIKSSLLSRICTKASPASKGGKCGEISVALQFIVDSSSSVTRPNFAHAKSFVKNVSSVFDLRNGQVRVGVLSYETNVNANGAILLGNIHSQDKFNEEVDAMPYTGGDTHTGAALQ